MPINQPININLEALRGYAAIFVVIGHWTLNGQYTPMPLVVFSPSPHLFLLVFFVLSGYVITISNKGMANYAQIINYVKKRLLRIYPIYFLALLVTLIIAGFHYSASAIFWNFAMMQDLITSPFAENGPTWSLHFEMLFYLLFIPLIFFRLNFIAVLVLSMLLAVCNYCFQLQLYPPIVSLYLLGFAFWMGGACIAKYFTAEQAEVDHAKLLSALFFILATDQMITRSGLPALRDSAGFLLFKQHLPDTPPGIGGMAIVLGYQDLALLPYCLYTVLVFSGRKLKHEGWWFTLLLMPLLYSVYVALTEPAREHAMAFAAPVGYLGLSLIFRFVNWPVIEGLGRAMVRIGAWLGSISYGIYIIHAPLLYLVGRINIAGNPLMGYLIKLSLLFALIIMMAYLLEKVFQLRIRNLISGKIKAS
ncbi:acyltransferase family protein [Mucilaginibacter calamicampi]|uniref:Acyltransferase family protein n=1 Tax=Mucilaginibacter calamicampi TaxID=1302352 RepID=A0ABW2YXR4_9SPHI